MSRLSRVRKYFFPKQIRIHRVPRQTIGRYDLTLADVDELLLVESGRARDPKEARRLLDRAKMGAVDYLEGLPEPESHFKRRLVRVFQKMLGENPYQPRHKPVRGALPVRFHYSDKA